MEGNTAEKTRSFRGIKASFGELQVRANRLIKHLPFNSSGKDKDVEGGAIVIEGGKGSRVVVVPPDPILLKSALSTDSKVKYLPWNAFDNSMPQNTPMREWIRKKLKEPYVSERDIAVRFYDQLISSLKHDIFRTSQTPSIRIRGSAVNIGDTISSDKVMGGKIKGIKEVVETGEERVVYPGKYWFEGGLKYELTSRDNIDGPTHMYPAIYANGHTDHIRSVVPEELKKNICPALLVRVRREDKLTCIYILDNIRVTKTLKK